jgi:hypothetical protein
LVALFVARPPRLLALPPAFVPVLFLLRVVLVRAMRASFSTEVDRLSTS